MTACIVMYDSTLGAAACRIDVPLFRSSRDQHDTCNSRGLAQAHPIRACRGGAASRLITKQGINIFFDVRRRGFDIDLIQADFEFFAHEHGGTRIDSLSDFGVRQDQCDRVMRIDPQERIRLKVAGHIGRRARKARQMQAKQQATAHCRAGLQHKPP